MNGDGLDDIIYMPGQMHGPAVYIFYQDSETGLSSTPVGYSYEIDYYQRFHGIATGDLNNDGRNDLVGTIGGNTAWIAVVYQNQDGTLGEATFLSSYDIPTPAEIADLNCDGKNEIIIGHDAWSHFSVWEQDETGNFSGYQLFGSLYYVGPYGLAVGDMNSDSRQDVLTTSGYSTNYLMYNTSAPEGTMPLDTLIDYTSIQTDTINSWDNTYQATDTARIGDCLLETTYELNVTTYYVYEQTTGDSLFPRNFWLCGLNQIDTLKSHFEYSNYFNKYSTDSTIIAVDTLVENIVITNVTTTYDTLNVTPHIFDRIEVELTYNFTPDTVYMYIDSLQIHTYYIEIEYLETVRSAYEGLKCGEPFSDTLVLVNHLWNTIIMQSDTTLISHTVIAFPLGVNGQAGLSAINVYPNPARGEFMLEIPDEYSGEAPFYISLIAMNGKIVWETTLNEKALSKTVVDGSNLPRGLYTLRVQGRTRSGAFKVMLAE
ncbi:MAG: T9SS type A sorting domain-containing protein, partial [Lentimicrobium sp.]|nr:T9SS type A sorting domain-containing protein [Lentimicrobium sp.]